jgi:hypothetical protein
MAQGWFRRPKGRLVYVWQIEDPTTGRKLERAKVVGDATLSDEEGWQMVGAMKQNGGLVFVESQDLGLSCPHSWQL